jgi:hypothetical protein
MKRTWTLTLVVLVLMTLAGNGAAYSNPAATALNGTKTIGHFIWVWHSETIAANQTKQIEADCPKGRALISGGYSAAESGAELAISKTVPDSEFDGWLVAATNRSAPVTLAVYAGCE